MEYGGQAAQFYHPRTNNIIFKGICKSLFLIGLHANICSTDKIQRMHTLEEAIQATIISEDVMKGPLEKMVTTYPKMIGVIRRRYPAKQDLDQNHAKGLHPDEMKNPSGPGWTLAWENLLKKKL